MTLYEMDQQSCGAQQDTRTHKPDDVESSLSTPLDSARLREKPAVDAR
jgi:hypothetical protein